MTSRFPARALRPGSMSVQTLKDFLDFMSCWERHANGAGGFLSASTAVGLRVTISSTLALLDHLKKHNFKYLMTARLSQDPLENFFGIVRQSCGSNDHPTPTQFLIVVNCLSFYNLAKAVSSGNAELGEEMSSLLEPSDGSTREVRVDDLDNAVEAGNLDLADRILQRIPSDHKEYVEQKSDDRLIYYMSGYVARKFLKRNDCTECRNVLLLTTAKPAKNCEFIELCDRGGLLYPSDSLFEAVKKLEGIFTTFFSKQELCSNSVVDVMLLAKKHFDCTLGCSQHADLLTAAVVKFYVLTRLHFFVKGINQSREAKRKKKLHAKISRCS